MRIRKRAVRCFLVAATCCATLAAMATTQSAHAQSLFADAVNAAGPTGYWQLNEAGGPTAVNLGTAGGSANGTYTGSPTFSVAGPSSANGFDGFAPTNTGVGFPPGSSVSLPTGFLPTSSNPRTYSLWFDADSGPTNGQAAFSYGNNATGQRINISADSDEVAIAVNGHNYGLNGLALSGWNQLAITLPSGTTSSGGFQFYLNGAPLTGLTNIAGSPQTVNTQNSAGAIGSNVFGGAAFSGSLDEVAVYNGALTANEIAHQYNAALGLETTTTVGLSDFTTVSKSGESPGTSGLFAGPLYVRERANGANPELEVEAFIKFDLSGVSGDITSATLVLPETNKLNNSNSANIFMAQVLEDWDSMGLDPVFGDGLLDGTDVTGELLIGTNGVASAGPAVDIDHFVDITALAQLWLSDPASNFGLRLRLNDAFVGAAFDANSVRLILGQQVQVPEPTSVAAWLLVAGLAMFAAVCRRRKASYGR
ncbi:MAG: LamG domain-containing protein [Planctomycetales bacterium]|nr:LamG domain-containing protein [Planctomycetales bacterium]